MAAFDTSRPMSSAAGVGSITKVLASVYGAIANWNDNRMTQKTLSKLTDRELDDIGLCRGDLNNI